MSSIAYMEPEALETFKSSLNTYNSNCLSYLKSFSSHASSLSSSWKGLSSDGYKNSVGAFVTNANNCHENMKDLNAFIEDIIVVMENQ